METTTELLALSPVSAAIRVVPLPVLSCARVGTTIMAVIRLLYRLTPTYVERFNL
uniref:Uncharacterized protein n=1 Tax=Picea glauca TaxID=3330 RepID=A0A117NJ47_PICGL|nr:hypothetical protein ABT39_MTgene834 [Picea glauca]